jgi:hypothetical protein
MLPQPLSIQEVRCLFQQLFTLSPDLHNLNADPILISLDVSHGNKK